MLRNINMNLLTTVLVFFSIIIMSVGYSAFNTELSISGIATVLRPQGIKISNATLLETTNGGSETYSPSFTPNYTEFYVSLPNEDSTATFLIEVTNNDNIYYHLDSVIEDSLSNSSVGYEIVDKESLYFLENSVTEIEINFFYKDTNTSSTNISLSLEYNFSEVPYRRLEYARSTGTQWMYTGVMNTGKYIFEDEFLITDVGTGSNTGSWILGGRVNPNYSLGVFANNTQVIAAYGTTTQTMTPKILEDVWYEMYFSMDRLTIGANNYNLLNETLIPEAYISELILGGNLLAYDGISKDDRNMKGMRKYFKITDAYTGNYIKYFVPVMINDTGEIGFWDEINGVFRKSDGTEDYLYP